MAAFGYSDDAIDRICALLDGLSTSSSMDWKYLANHLQVNVKDIAELDQEQVPERALLGHLEKESQFTIDELIRKCRQIGFKNLADVMEKERPKQTEVSSRSTEQSPIPADQSMFVEVKYEVLKCRTNNFADCPYGKGGYKLGEGGFGEVFHVKISIKGGNKHECAVKRLKKQKDVNLSEFKRELAVMQGFRHPHIMPLFGVSLDGEFPCIIYHYMPNGSLKSHLTRREALSPWQRLTIIRGVASALDYLHTKGKSPLVHRDVKSDNILLNGKLQAVLSDFGITRFLASHEQSKAYTQAIGTRPYMSPESLDGTVSPPGDVYSLGIVLLEVLVNKCTSRNLELKSLLDKGVEDLIRRAMAEDIGWQEDHLVQLMKVAESCTDFPRKRPTAKELEQLIQPSMYTISK